MNISYYNTIFHSPLQTIAQFESSKSPKPNHGICSNLQLTSLHAPTSKLLCHMESPTHISRSFLSNWFLFFCLNSPDCSFAILSSQWLASLCSMSELLAVLWIRTLDLKSSSHNYIVTKSNSTMICPLPFTLISTQHFYLFLACCNFVMVGIIAPLDLTSAGQVIGRK
jgi:hypothetical protein